MPKRSQSDTPIWDFVSWMNGAKIHFASGGSVQSSVVGVGGLTLELVCRTQEEWQLYSNQAVCVAWPWLYCCFLAFLCLFSGPLSTAIPSIDSGSTSFQHISVLCKLARLIVFVAIKNLFFLSLSLFFFLFLDAFKGFIVVLYVPKFHSDVI